MRSQQYDGKPEDDEQTADFPVLPIDVDEERRLFKLSVADLITECRQFRKEIQKDQAKTAALLDFIKNRSERPVKVDRIERPAIFANQSPMKPAPVKAESTPLRQPSSKPGAHNVSRSVTKVRRDLLASKGRVRSIVDAFNSKRRVSPVISSIGHKSIVNTIASTINQQNERQHPPKAQPPASPTSPGSPASPKSKQPTGPTRRPNPPVLCSDPQTLPKEAKLQLIAEHRFHRLMPVPEETSSQALVIHDVPNTIVMRRPKAVKIRNLNAFHCPVMKPRFGLKRKVLAPPVPRHSMPPVSVPGSKYVDLGRRRVSKIDWCFVV